MRYLPTKGRVIVFQEKARKVGNLYLADEAVQHSVTAEVKCANTDSEFKEGMRVFFDRSAGSIISDTDDGIWSVVEESEILAIVEKE